MYTNRIDTCGNPIREVDAGNHPASVLSELLGKRRDKMNKPYLLDNEPVTAEELIQAAVKLDHSYACDWMRQTSVAAIILRSNGHSVEENNISSDA